MQARFSLPKSTSATLSSTIYDAEPILYFSSCRRDPVFFSLWGLRWHPWWSFYLLRSFNVSFHDSRRLRRHCQPTRVQPQPACLTCWTIQLVATRTRSIMDISNPPQQAHGLPQIFIQSSNTSDRRMIPSRSSTSAYQPSTSGLSSSIPMSIPNTRDDESFAPPPLPPPRYITAVKSEKAGCNGGGSANPWPAWNPGTQNSWGERSSVKSEPSLYESFPRHGSGVADELGMRRGSSNATIKSISELDGHQNSYPRADEGYASLSTTGSMSSS